MKRIALCFLAAMLMLSGCAASQEEPFRVDTVVQIPVDPTEEPSETVTEAPTEAPTEQATESPTEAPTEPKETTPKKTTTSSKSSSSSGKSSSSSGKSSSSSSSSSSKNQSTSKKEPAATQPPKTTEPPATQPPKTTEPPVTVPAETTIPTVATEPPSETATEPATEDATEPPADSDIELPTEEPAVPPTEESTVPPTEEPTVPPTEAPTEPPYDPSSYGVGGLEATIASTLNAYRLEAGLPELSLSGRLSGIAFIRAQEISVSWSHARPDGRGYTSALDDYGYGYSSVSENLLYVSGGGDGVAIADRWMASDSNSAEILSDSYTAIGVGVYYAGGMTYVACLLVG